VIEAEKVRYEKQKQKEKKGMFGGWFSKSEDKDEDSNSFITNQDKEEMEKFIQENFSEEVLNMPVIKRPKEYVYLKVGKALLH